MSDNSRRRARTWPYPRYARFRSAVRDAATAWFFQRRLETHPKYPYILANWDDWPNNMILPDVAQYVRHTAETQRAEGSPFPLHKYIHHGLSSQALLFNLVGPMLLKHDLTPLQRALQTKGVPVPAGSQDVVLEYENRGIFNEDTGQPTSIDLAIGPSSGGSRIFIECKFVEQEFGGCSVFAEGDCDGRNPAGDLGLCYLHHIGRRYWEAATRHGLLEGPIRTERLCVLAPHYQFFREVLFALENDGVFVLLSDERSPVFSQGGPKGDKGERGLMPVLLSLLPDAIRPRVIQLSIQELLKEISSTQDESWVSQFKEKYGLS